MGKKELPYYCRETMKLKHFLTGKIPKERKEHLDRASDYLRNNKVEEAEKELKWIEVSDNIREKSAAWASRNKWPVLIGLICLLYLQI